MALKLPNGREKRPSPELKLASNKASMPVDVVTDGILDEGLRELVDATLEGVTIHQDRIIVYANRAAVEQYGANDPAEIIGRDVFDLIVGDDRERIEASIQQLYEKGGRSALMLFRRYCLDGRVTHVEAAVIRILWKDRPAILSMARDVTAHLQVEERLRRLLSAGTHWLWESDTQHRCTFLSEGPDNINFFNQRHVLGKTRWELAGASPDDPLWRKHVADLNAKRPFHNFEYRNIGPSGKETWNSVSGMPVFDVDGVFKGYRGITSNIIERRCAEAAFRESKQRIKLALEGAKGGIFDINIISGEVTYDEQSALMLGYDRAEEIPRQLCDWMERVHPNDRELAQARLDQLLEGKAKVLLSEQRQRTKSGDWLWFSCIGKVVERDNDGRPIRLVGMRFDITERKQAQQTIEHMALHDGLTQLPNRACFTNELRRACRAARRGGTKLAVLFLDLDNFKDINDTFGHSIGDKLLIEVAYRLKSCLHGDDLVARFGGDEFVMVVPHPHDPASISYLADRIIKAIAVPYDIDGLDVHTTISVGIAIFPDNGTDTERILANADLALYTAKRAGRQTWRVFDHCLQRQLQAQRSLDHDLRHALDRRQFELHYQPLINIADDRIDGFQALIRWNHPERGQALPSAFIPATEQNRLIIPLTEWVLQEATLQQQRWAATGLGDFKISINISQILLKLQGFVDLLDRCIAETGCDPRKLIIEITESARIDEAAVTNVLKALRERGVTIAIDDSGTGYSSMVRLKTLPVDVLKIDRSFLANVIQEASDASIIDSLVNVGHCLGKKVVAEGVETAEQLRFLKGIGCDIAQGFFITPRCQPPTYLLGPNNGNHHDPAAQAN